MLTTVFIFLICAIVFGVLSFLILLLIRLTILKQLKTSNISLMSIASAIVLGGLLSFFVIQNGKHQGDEKLNAIAKAGCVLIDGPDLEMLNAFFKEPFSPGIYKVEFNPGTIDYGAGEEETVDLRLIGSRSIRPVMKRMAAKLNPIPCPSH